MSRVHKGQSPSYERKILVREARTFDRLMFRCSKYFHDKHYNIEPGNDDNTQENKQGQGSGGSDNAFLDRAFIRRYKTKIYRYLEKDERITQSNFSQWPEDTLFNMVVQKFKNDDKKASQ